MAKNRFTTPLDLREIGYETWKTLRETVYVSDRTVTVPKGFVTDLASVHPLFRSLIPQIGYWSHAAVVHDFLYHEHREGIDDSWTRKEADLLFKEMVGVKAKEYGVPNRYGHFLYLGVRMGGPESWETPAERASRRKDDWLDD